MDCGENMRKEHIFEADKKKALDICSVIEARLGTTIDPQAFKAYGLQEGVHFYTQKQMDGEKKRPDFTIMLPENKKVNMDSKFPHVNYANMTSEDDPERKEKYGKEFLKDVKEHIKQLSGKGIILMSQSL